MKNFIGLNSRAFCKPFGNKGPELQTVDGAEFSWDERVFPTAEDRALNLDLVVPGLWDGSDILIYVQLRTPAIVGDTKWDFSFAQLPVGTERSTTLLSPIDSIIQAVPAVPPTGLADFTIACTWAAPPVSRGDLVVLTVARNGTNVLDTVGGYIYFVDAWIEFEDARGAIRQYDASAQCIPPNTDFILPPLEDPYVSGTMMVFHNGAKIMYSATTEVTDRIIRLGFAPLGGDSLELVYVPKI